MLFYHRVFFLSNDFSAFSAIRLSFNSHFDLHFNFQRSCGFFSISGVAVKGFFVSEPEGFTQSGGLKDFRVTAEFEKVEFSLHGCDVKRINVVIRSGGVLRAQMKQGVVFFHSFF